MTPSDRQLCLIFRMTVVAAPLLVLLGVAYTTLATPHFSREWQELIAQAGNGSIVPAEEEDMTSGSLFLVFQVFGFVLAAMVNQVALFFFWGPSRHIYAICMVISFAMVPLFGLVVQPPIESLLYEISLFLSGITLALAYASPVAGRFRKAESLP